MTLPLFDVQSGFGGAAAGQRHVLSADELVAEMRRLEDLADKTGGETSTTSTNNKPK